MKTRAVTIEDVARATSGHASGNLNVEVTDVIHDSRQAKSGSLFVAVRGELFDAHKFIPHVLEQGAVGILSELDSPTDWGRLREMQSGKRLAPPAWIKVENIRRAM